MTYALEIRSLKKIYANGVEALKGINLVVSPGDFLALLGPNGAGKSTTISIVNSLLLKTSGDVFIHGYDLTKEPALAKAYIGVVPQEFNFNIFEKVQNILVDQAGYYGVARTEAIKRAEKYLKLLELWDKRHQSARSLSGGMKRRLMIARALMHEPHLLILDEPTAGVDVEIRRSMWALLRKLNEDGKTIILTTHYLEEAEHLCDRIAIIHKGEIMHDLPKKKLLSLLNVETFILDLSHPIEKKLPEIPHVKIRVKDEMTLEVICEKTVALNTLFQYLSEQNIIVSSMRNEANRLETLFLRLTSNNGN